MMTKEKAERILKEFINYDLSTLFDVTTGTEEVSKEVLLEELKEWINTYL